MACSEAKNGDESSWRFKQFVEINTIIPSAEDTIHWVICGDYVFEPFGEIVDHKILSNRKLQKFKIKRDSIIHLQSLDGKPYQSYEAHLAHGSSILDVYIDKDPEVTRNSYITSGFIKDSDIVLGPGIRVGMSIDEFLKIFCLGYPPIVDKRRKVVLIESCVTSINHLYIFENGKLGTIRFE